MRKIIDILSAVLVLSFAGPGAFAFRNISQDDGLSNDCVTGITRDANGYIWLSTRTGADKYDGSRFKSYPYSFGEIICAPSGALFAYTKEGVLYRFDPELDDFSVICSIPTPLIHDAIAVEHDGATSIIAGCSTGVYIIGYDDAGCSPVKISGFNTHQLCRGKGDSIYAGTEEGVHLIYHKGGSYAYSDSPAVSSGVTVRMQSLWYDPQYNRLWAGSYSDGLFIFNPDDWTSSKIKGISDRYPLRAISNVEDAEVWVGSDGNGIYTLDRAGSSVTGHISMLGGDTGRRLSGNGIYQIFYDGEQAWICTYTGGVNIYEPERYAFKEYLKGTHINVVLEKSDGSIWFGTDDGIVICDEEGRPEHCLLQCEDGGQGEYNVVLALHEDADGDIWAGGYAMGAVRISGSGLTIKETFRTSNSGLGSNSIFDICSDSNGRIWFAGIVGPLSFLDPDTRQFSRVEVYNTQTLRPLDNEMLLAGSKDGLTMINCRSLDYSPISEDAPSNTPLFILSIYRKNQETVLLGTQSGTRICDLTTAMIQPLIREEASAAPYDYVYSILEDNLGRIWTSREYGLECYDPVTGQKLSISRKNGLSEDTFCRDSYTRLKCGDFIFGSVSGAVRIRPEDIYTTVGKRPFYLTGLQYGNETLNLEMKGSPERIRLRNSNNSFTVYYSCPDYSSRNDISYQWKMEGLVDEWSEHSESNSTTFTSLSPGRYHFKVRSYVNSILNEERAIDIIIRPPIWRSPTAILLYLLLVFFILFLAQRVYKERLEADHSDDKIKFFINIAHEIRTPVSLIKSPLQDIGSKENLSVQGRYALSLAQKNADKLLHVVNQLLDFQKTEREAMTVSARQTGIKSYLSERVNLFRRSADEKRQNLFLTLPEEDRLVWFDTDKMNSILDNLLSNALKYTDDGGTIEVSLKYTEDSYQICVKDNGIGIPDNARGLLFSRFFRADNAINSKTNGSGIGLMLTRNLTSLMHGTISYSPAESGGSAFTLQFPFGKDHYTPEQIVALPIGVPEPPEGGLSPSDETEPAEKPLLVIAEDNDELRGYLCSSLASGFRTIAAEDGVVALNIIRKKEPDLVISDVLMPRMQGDALCRIIKEDAETSHIPVVLLTALSDNDQMVSGLDCGADAYITKPFDMSVLTAYVRNILRNRKALHDKFRFALMDPAKPLPESAVPTGKERDFLSKLYLIMEEHLDDQSLDVNTLCRQMAMSRTVFYKKITAVTGLAPNDFIKMLRMRKAKCYLSECRYTIPEVASMVGFGDPKYFSTAFKKYFGMSPSAFLAEMKASK